MMDFNKYAAKGNQILDEVAAELGFEGDRERASRILRAVLHTLRERLTIQESFQLIAQLPFVIKALYVEGWKYQEKPFRIKHVGEFVKNVIHEDFPVGHHDISTAKDGENAIMAVLKVIRRHVSEGEIKDILATIPTDLHPLWGETKKEPSS